MPAEACPCRSSRYSETTTITPARADEVAEALRAGGIVVLDRDHVVLELGEIEVGIVGTKGFVGGFAGAEIPDFGEPTLRQIYHETSLEVEALEVGLEAVAGCHKRIVLLHYAPITDTIVGEPESIWAFLGSGRLAGPIGMHRPELVVHGHAHHGARQGAIGTVPVHNVAVHVDGSGLRDLRALSPAGRGPRPPSLTRSFATSTRRLRARLRSRRTTARRTVLRPVRLLQQALGDRLDLLERLLLLPEVLLEQLDRLALAESAGLIDEARVGGDLVVLRPCAAPVRNASRICGLGSFSFMNSSCSFLMPSIPGHGWACALSPTCLKTFSRLATCFSVSFWCAVNARVSSASEAS